MPDIQLLSNKPDERNNRTYVDGKVLRIGISGGTFDPVHNGHLLVAEDIRERFNLDKVIFIPSGNPPHKAVNRVTDAELRFDMVKTAIESNPFFEASRIEIDRNGYTYTVDTLQELKALVGDGAKIFFIIGADVVLDLLSWRDCTKVFTLCEFIATLRPGYSSERFNDEIEMLRDRYGALIHVVDAPLVDISSTAIRERIKLNKSIKYLVPENIEKLILCRKLYK